MFFSKFEDMSILNSEKYVLFPFWAKTLTLPGPGFPWQQGRASLQEVMFRVVGPVVSPGNKKIPRE